VARTPVRDRCGRAASRQRARRSRLTSSRARTADRRETPAWARSAVPFGLGRGRSWFLTAAVASPAGVRFGRAGSAARGDDTTASKERARRSRRRTLGVPPGPARATALPSVVLCFARACAAPRRARFARSRWSTCGPASRRAPALGSPAGTHSLGAARGDDIARRRPPHPPPATGLLRGARVR